SQFLERYFQTLDEWAKEGVPAATGFTGSNSSSAGSAAAPVATTADQRPFLRELHRVLGYEFIDPYEQHRHATQWDEQASADAVFRGDQAAQSSAWKRLQKLLDSYNEAIAQESPAWSAAQRAVTASARLRQWDRRVRVAA